MSNPKKSPASVPVTASEVPSPIAPHLAKLFGLDPFLIGGLWAHWKEQNLQICDECGHVRNPQKGHCTANSKHGGEPYKSDFGFRHIVYL